MKKLYINRGPLPAGEFVVAQVLWERGWTDELIADLLSPATTVQVAGQTISLYLRVQVEVGERAEQFRSHLRNLVDRLSDEARARREVGLGMLSAGQSGIPAGLTRQQLDDLALAHYAGLRHCSVHALPELDAGTMDRLTVNALVHGQGTVHALVTDSNALIGELDGATYNRLQFLICSDVATLYPRLRTACRERLVARVTDASLVLEFDRQRTCKRTRVKSTPTVGEPAWSGQRNLTN